MGVRTLRDRLESVWNHALARRARSHLKLPGRDARAAFASNPGGLVGAAVLVAMASVAALADSVYPGDPLDMVAQPLSWPGTDSRFWLGTDSLGRSVAACLVHGARISLAVGVLATLVSLLIGIVVGALSGYLGGLVDQVLMRVVEVVQVVPAFLFVLTLVAVNQPHPITIAAGIGLVAWPVIARLVRAEFIALRGSEFVVAARSQGFSPLTIMSREILPNALAPVMVSAPVLVANAILMESALSFLGVSGPNTVSWGTMISEGRDVIQSAWYLTALPGSFIAVTVVAFNLVGDALNDALDPRVRGYT